MGLFDKIGIAPGQPGAPTTNVTEIEKQMAAGGLAPEGVHHAILDAVGAIPGCDNRGWKLTFLIVAGAGNGMRVEETLWKPKGDGDEKKDGKVRNRILLFGHRLGLLKRDGNGNLVEIEGKYDFGDCIGATCFIEVKHEEEEWTPPGKTVAVKMKKAKLTFDGVLSPEDKRCKDVPKASGLAAAAAGAGAAAKRDDFGKL